MAALGSDDADPDRADPGEGAFHPIAAIEREFFTKGRPSSLLQRFATAEEVASVVAFVCSPLASAINGAAVRAEGGVLQSIA